MPDLAIPMDTTPDPDAVAPVTADPPADASKPAGTGADPAGDVAAKMPPPVEKAPGAGMKVGYFALEGTAGDAHKERVAKAMERALRAIGRKPIRSPGSVAEAASVIGCSPEELACWTTMATAMGVDELALGTLNDIAAAADTPPAEPPAAPAEAKPLPGEGKKGKGKGKAVGAADKPAGKKGKAKGKAAGKGKGKAVAKGKGKGKGKPKGKAEPEPAPPVTLSFAYKVVNARGIVIHEETVEITTDDSLPGSMVALTSRAAASSVGDSHRGFGAARRRSNHRRESQRHDPRDPGAAGGHARDRRTQGRSHRRRSRGADRGGCQ